MKLSFFVVIFQIFLLSACQSLSGTEYKPLDKLLAKSSVIASPIVVGNRGLLFVPLSVAENTGYFLIDTAATQSAVFENTRLGLLSRSQSIGSANVFGLVEKGNYPLIYVKDLSVASRNIPPQDFVVLPERKNQVFPDGINHYDGLIGMDFLVKFNLFVDPDQGQIYFVPRELPQPDIVQSWTPVQLLNNPNSELGKELRFFDLRVGNQLIPALLDTGSDFNIVNWQATQIPELKRLKRRLRQEWELQGASGVFDPAIKIDVKTLRAGQMRWGRKEFIVMDFDHLDGVGFKDEPVVIAGAPLLQGKRYYVDFKRQFIWFEPETKVN